jgi:hypothetical protein
MQLLAIRENQRQTARENRRLLEREHRNPADALENTLKVLAEQHKLPRRIVMTRWLSSVKFLLQAGQLIKISFSMKPDVKGRTYMRGCMITLFLGGTIA